MRRRRLPTGTIAEAAASMPEKGSLASQDVPGGENAPRKVGSGRACPTEDMEQFRVVEWLRWNRVVFHHSPNGGARHIATAARLKRQGTQAGFPDLIILDPPPAMPGIHSVAIEMKRQTGGKTSDEQIQWLLLLDERNWYTAICHGADAAIETLKRLGYGRKGA